MNLARKDRRPRPRRAGPSVASYRGLYEYDANGNRTAKPEVAYLNEFSASKTGTSSTWTYDYTFSGTAGKSPNVQKRTKGTEEHLYSYDHLSRLTGYVKKVSSTTTVDYSYGMLPTGERLSKVNNLSGTNNEEWYFCQGQDVVADYVRSTGAGSYPLANTYVNAGAIDSKVARLKEDLSELYYVSDALGTVHRVINGSEVVQNTVLTTAWGEDHPGFSDLVVQPDRYGFAQRENDAESGLIFMRARSYDPRLARFSTKDPADAQRVSDHFIYAKNQPLGFKDPTGYFARGAHSEITSATNPRLNDTPGDIIAEIVRANIEQDFPVAYRGANPNKTATFEPE